jgi:small conductance mechanosensitive channel
MLGTNDVVGNASSKLEHIKTQMMEFGVDYGWRVLGAFLTLLIGLFIARWVGAALKRSLDKHQMEPPVRLLLVRLTRLIILALTLVSVLEKFGVPVTSLVAGIGVAGLGVGLALQGLLSNVFAGLTIIFTRPFRVDEYIELVGVSGQVTSIDLFTTTLIQGDTSQIIIPNRSIVGEILRNYGVIRQLNMTVAVAYDSDISKVLASVNQILATNPRVLKTPAAVVGVLNLGDSAISVYIRPFTKLTDYGPAQAEIYKAVLERFRSDGITIPFPQHQIQLLNPPQAA